MDIGGSKVFDLSPLKGSPITELKINGCPVTDFRPLLDLPKLEKLKVSNDARGLEVLRSHGTLSYLDEDDNNTYRPVAEFWPKYDARVAAARERLKRLVMEKSRAAADGPVELNLHGQNLTDLSGLGLEGAKITNLIIDGNPIADLSPLRGMPLKVLYLGGSQVRDLSPLRGLPLERLYFNGTPVKDLRPLLEMPKLRRVLIPSTAENIEILRPLTQLEYLGWDRDEGAAVGPASLTPAEFWKRFDALRKGAAEKR